MLHRIRDLAEQSANGTYGADERKAMQSEVNNLVSELYRTKNSTEFNGKQILGAESTHPITEEEAIAEGYTTVHTAQELKEAIRTIDPNCKVMLFADIDLNDLEFDETGSNWTPITYFHGVFDGNGFSVFNLTINKPNNDRKGFVEQNFGTIKNITLENVSVTGKGSVGGLAGVNASSGKIENCSVSGAVTGNSYTGGLVGYNYNRSTISNCSSSGSVTGNGNYTGGLVGYNSSNSTIKNSSSSGSVTGSGLGTGGLVGGNTNSIISNSTSLGSVVGNNYTGGVVGNNYGTIENCSTDSKVTGTTNTGAFIGKYNNGTLSGNEYNSTINEGMKAVGIGLDNPTEEQIKDNPNLHIETPEPQAQANQAAAPAQPQSSGSTPSSTSVNLQVGIENDTESVITVDTGFEIGLFAVNIESEYGARSALAKIDALMTKMTDKQTELGAISSRLDSAMQYQAIQKTAKIATNSLIKDADFAAESSNYIKQQILQQTTSSLLSTANQNPNIALMLLNSQRR